MAAPCTPVWDRERAKNSFSAVWNSCSQPGLIRRVIATWIGSESAFALMSKEKSERGGEVVNVPAASLVNVAASKEIDVRRLQADVALNLPIQIHIKRRADVT